MKQGVVIAAMVVVLTMVLFKVEPGRAMTCAQVDTSLAPCLEYLTGGTTPSPGCCNGVKDLKAMTTTTADRRAACECIKQVAGRYASIKPDKASQLPQQCGIEINVPITKDVDCNKINP